LESGIGKGEWKELGRRKERKGIREKVNKEEWGRERGGERKGGKG